MQHFVAVTELLLKLIWSNYQILVVSDQEKHAASIGIICLFFLLYMENAIMFKTKNLLETCLSWCKNDVTRST